MRQQALRLFALSLALVACGTFLPGCAPDRTPTVEPDGRVTAPAVLPR